VGGLGAKGIKFYPWGPRIKLEMTFIVVNFGILIEYFIPI
jgi:hypothetical protein